MKKKSFNLDIKTILIVILVIIILLLRSCGGGGGSNKPGETIKIPTGIRCKMEDGWVLKIYPRSGLGFKYRLQLNNTVGIIDSDYYYSDNEGHIMIKVTNDSNENKTVEVQKGQGFAQGIFVEFGITYDDDTTDERNGGFGSTTSN